MKTEGSISETQGRVSTPLLGQTKSLGFSRLFGQRWPVREIYEKVMFRSQQHALAEGMMFRPVPLRHEKVSACNYQTPTSTGCSLSKGRKQTHDWKHHNLSSIDGQGKACQGKNGDCFREVSGFCQLGN